jgi:hypothetical protein
LLLEIAFVVQRALFKKNVIAMSKSSSKWVPKKMCHVNVKSLFPSLALSLSFELYDELPQFWVWMAGNKITQDLSQCQANQTYFPKTNNANYLIECPWKSNANNSIRVNDFWMTLVVFFYQNKSTFKEQ